MTSKLFLFNVLHYSAGQWALQPAAAPPQDSSKTVASVQDTARRTSGTSPPPSR